MPEKSPYTPHPVLDPHFTDLREKQPFLRRVFDDSAKHYEPIASWGFFGNGDWYRRQALRRAGLVAGMRVIAGRPRVVGQPAFSPRQRPADAGLGAVLPPLGRTSLAG